MSGFRLSMYHVIYCEVRRLGYKKISQLIRINFVTEFISIKTLHWDRNATAVKSNIDKYKYIAK